MDLFRKALWTTLANLKMIVETVDDYLYRHLQYLSTLIIRIMESIDSSSIIDNTVSITAIMDSKQIHS
jgi:hypothetical protein